MTRALTIAIDARHVGQYGIGRYIHELVRALARIESDEQFVIITRPPGRRLVPDSTRFRIVENDTGLYSTRAMLSVGRSAEHAGADVLHATHYVVPFTRLPVVTTLHDIIHLELPGDQISCIRRFYARSMIRRAIRVSKAIITPSEAVRTILGDRIGADLSKIQAIPHGVDHDRFRPGTQETDRPESRYLLYVGNDKPHKNLDRLIAAYEMARERIEGVELVLAGSRFARFSRHDGVRTEGRVPDDRLPELYRRAMAVILPSLLEGFGLPALEAMASGTPVCVSDIPALREVVGDAGLFFDPLKTEAIAQALGDLTTNSELRDSLAARGLTRASGFQWDEAARSTLEVYRAVASQ